MLGVRRSASDEGDEYEDVGYERTRPLKQRSWRRRLALGVVKVFTVVIALFLAAVALLYAFTPRGQPSHLAWPRPRRPSTTSPTLARRCRSISRKPWWRPKTTGSTPTRAWTRWR